MTIGGAPWWKYLIGFGLAMLVGGFCRWLKLPAPGPPALSGAFLVVAVSLGYVLADKIFSPPKAEATPTVTLEE